MGGGAPSPPSISGSIFPNSTQLGNIQQQANVGSQAGSNYTQVNPYGAVTFGQTGVGPNGVPIYDATQLFSPSQQALYNQYTSGQMMEGNLGQQMLANMNYPQNMPIQTLGNMTSGLTGQMMDAYTAGLQPSFNLQTEQAQANLENQGFSPKSSGYYAGMLPVETGQASALATGLANFEPQAYSQSMQSYSLPYQWALQSLGSAQPNLPNAMFTGGAQNQPSNYIGAYGTVGNTENQIYQSQVQQFQAQQELMAGLIGAGGKLAGGLLGGI